MNSVTVLEDVNWVTVEEQPTLVSITGDGTTLTVVQDLTTLTVTQVTPILQVDTPGVQGSPGPPGAKGDKGDKGDPGAAGSGFVFTQSSPASSWTVPHNLHRHPNVSYVDATGHVWIADVQHIDVDTVVLVFPSPTSGEAVCS